MFHPRFHPADSPATRAGLEVRRIDEVPDQRGRELGGDDGTRTHDPLLANKPNQDG
jgi:hypothetical protein